LAKTVPKPGVVATTKLTRLNPGGVGLVLARGFWLFTAGVMVLVFVIASIHVYQFYLTPCATWTIDPSCQQVVGLFTAWGFEVHWLAFLNLLTVVLVGLPWMLIAYFIFVQRGAEVSGWLLSLALLTGWASDLTNVNVRHHVWWALEGLKLGYLPHALVYFVGLTSQASVIMLGFLLPNGRFTPRWTLYFAILWMFYMVAETAYRYPFLESPAWFVYPETLFTFAAPLLASYALWHRYRVLKRNQARLDGPEFNNPEFNNPEFNNLELDNSKPDNSVTRAEQKRQLEAIVPSVITLVATYTLMTGLLFLFWRHDFARIDDTPLRYGHDLLQNLLQAACALWFIVALGIAIFRHRLFGLELLVSRTFVYGGLSTVLLGVYLMIVLGVGTLIGRQSLWPSLLATSLVVLLFQPLRERFQRYVNQRFYGARNEPFEVMRQVGEQVHVLSPQDALPALAQTLQEMFRLPYVALTIYNSLYEPGPRTVKVGMPGKRVVQFPLFAGQELGVLEVSPRDYEIFSEREEKLLETLAKEIAVGVRSTHLSAELQASREHLVTTREEERRRLRRDLHDGLGPTLAAQTLKIGAARSLLYARPHDADTVLAGLEQDISGTLDYVRQLVYSLRPPLLDQLGLKGALEQQLGKQLSGHSLRFNLCVTELPALPAAVEVASYFIITEAFHNVLRHARATTCDIRVAVVPGQVPTLELLICDDGRLQQDLRVGVGLSSMRERCEELGGSLELRFEDGFCVRALLPLQSQPSLAQSGQGS
jgi:signal transduction histidine kinase